MKILHENSSVSDSAVALKAKYRQYNESFEKSMSYGVGLYAGFFSEINLMVLGVVYCLHHKIQFKLHSSSANFRRAQGWKDYFEPFCPEVTSEKLDQIDQRERIQYQFDPTKPRRLYRMAKAELELSLLKRKLGVDYLTFDLLDEILNRKLEKIHYRIPELEIDGDLREACRIVASMVWQLNPETQKLTDRNQDELNLPDRYLGFQIRRGDKHQEIGYTDTGKYFEIVAEKSNIRDAFVLTDDYGVIEEIRSTLPDWTIHTLSQPEERGYAHGNFFAKSRDEVYQGTMKLIANIEILKKAEYFVGTFSANPSMFLGMVMDRSRAISVDVPWQVWYGKEA